MFRIGRRVFGPLFRVACALSLFGAVGVAGPPRPAQADPPALPSTAYLPAISNGWPPAGGDSRFGVVVASGDPGSALGALGINWWYSFGQSTPNLIGNGVAQISFRPDGINLTQIPVATLQAAAQSFPGSYWLIGNEPNVPGQDNVTPDGYVTQLFYYVQAIKGADPTAKIVGPNVLNWDFTCTQCTGITSGHAWVDSFRAAWASQFGGEPPIDVWSLHAYTITWDQTPMTDAPLVEQQVSDFAAYLAGVPTNATKPIWLSEFGVIWGYDGWTTASSGCRQAPTCFAPVGSFDTTAATSFLTSLLTWLTAASGPDRLERWFLYCTAGAPEPYATTYAGIGLLNGTTLTPFGQIYRQSALVVSP